MATATEEATFAAGCFWGVEHRFRTIPGVIDAEVGYTGGSVDNPSYQMVCSGRTGHAEAVHLTFDPARVTYDELLEVFWALHDPTQLNRQGPDIGTQYRSAIFFHGSEQEKTAKASKERQQDSGRFRREIVTEIVPAARFWRAEEYHQQYAAKNGAGHCAV